MPATGVLTATLAHRWLVFVGFALVAVLCAVLLQTLKSELAPVEDRGTIVGVFNGPEGATLDYTENTPASWKRFTAARRISSAILWLRATRW